MKAHRKRFSPEEIEKRKARLMAVRHLGPAAMIRKAEARKEQRKSQRELVAAMAAQGQFVPVADFE